MEQNTINEIERIVKENINGKVVETKGRTFLFEDGRSREIEEKEYLLYDSVELTDLKSFCEIIKNEIDKINTTLFIQVVNPARVLAFTTLDGKNRRFRPYECRAERLCKFEPCTLRQLVTVICNTL